MDETYKEWKASELKAPRLAGKVPLEQLLEQGKEKAMAETEATLVCPLCHSPNLATIEELEGAAEMTARVDVTTGERTIYHEGWTDVWWDSSTTVGAECRDCEWISRDDDWLEDLILDPDSSAAQMELGDAPD